MTFGKNIQNTLGLRASVFV